MVGDVILTQTRGGDRSERYVIRTAFAGCHAVMPRGLAKGAYNWVSAQDFPRLAHRPGPIGQMNAVQPVPLDKSDMPGHHKRDVARMGNLAQGVGGAAKRQFVILGQAQPKARDVMGIQNGGQAGRKAVQIEALGRHKIDLGLVLLGHRGPFLGACGVIACATRHGKAVGLRATATQDNGTPMSTPPETRQPTFVLVRPQMGENIGAAARAMWNFGLDRMRVVAPRDGWPNERAVALASGAGRLLDQAGVVPDVPDAIEDCTYVFATTARPRGMTTPIVTPERAMQQARAIAESGGRVGVLFGPERAGLENDDIARANAIISVPVNPDFPSLNLAQCVLLCAYEWRRTTVETAPEVMEMAGTEFATAAELAALGDHVEDRLEAAGFFFPETKAPGMKRNLRQIWGRLPLTRADVQTFHGMFRQIVRWAEQKRGD